MVSLLEGKVRYANSVRDDNKAGWKWAVGKMRSAMSQQPKVAADSDRAQVLSVCSAVQCAVGSAVPWGHVGSDNPDRLDCPVETRSPTSTAEAFLRRTTRLGSGTSVGASVQRISASQNGYRLLSCSARGWAMTRGAGKAW